MINRIILCSVFERLPIKLKYVEMIIISKDKIEYKFACDVRIKNYNDFLYIDNPKEDYEKVHNEEYYFYLLEQLNRHKNYVVNINEKIFKNIYVGIKSILSTDERLYKLDDSEMIVYNWSYYDYYEIDDDYEFQDIYKNMLRPYIKDYPIPFMFSIIDETYDKDNCFMLYKRYHNVYYKYHNYNRLIKMVKEIIKM